MEKLRNFTAPRLGEIRPASAFFRNRNQRGKKYIYNIYTFYNILYILYNIYNTFIIYFIYFYNIYIYISLALIRIWSPSNRNRNFPREWNVISRNLPPGLERLALSNCLIKITPPPPPLLFCVENISRLVAFSTFATLHGNNLRIWVDDPDLNFVKCYQICILNIDFFYNCSSTCYSFDRSISRKGKLYSKWKMNKYIYIFCIVLHTGSFLSQYPISL